jgi:hypothetical protein
MMIELEKQPASPSSGKRLWYGFFDRFCYILPVLVGTLFIFFLLLDAHVKTAKAAKPSALVGFFLLFLAHLNL